ncbi:PhzF family phenazine biosynthesis isomerase [Sporomusa sp.]|uniref:PhzF family phenazine biosynthesis protein n=1 Tax=Sporomusa sp. TaxID=2078658 RepID=UPI002B9831D3|nr:PhzF family phenazine biosynthesis isomerase [Sporomusa sp.]HWR42075.1 PhzF family phenazine biosynthesis isomerase [Sporomusa sp.]
MLKKIIPVIHTLVFSAAPGGGNPCPVVFNCDQFTSEQMRVLAAHYMEETAFVIPSEETDCDVRLRYFVPNHEMEMCVHATMGSIAAQAHKSLLEKAEVKVEIPIGKLSAFWEQHEDHYEVTVEQFLPQFATDNPKISQVTAALNISEKAIALEIGPIQSVSTSRAKLMVPIKDRKTLDSLTPHFEDLWKLCDEYNTTGFYPFTIETSQGKTVIYARQFPKRAGYNEDAATGLAAGALGAYLSQYEVVRPKLDGCHTFEIHQGYAMGRPSVLYAEVMSKNGEITDVRIKGRAEITAEELLTFPFK